MVNYSLLDKETMIRQINRIRDMVSGNLPNIYLLHGEMTDEEMNLLNNDPKVKTFVSFTKGEGYGRPLAESAITGKPVYVAMMKPKRFSGRFRNFYSQFNKLGITKELSERVDNWSYDKLDEINRIVPIIKEKMKLNGII